ncbi:hypothetical protein V9T40_002318 [Parthenolecanium corni]|uniref:Hcy-binding domain-containing protein n=1 Tax=Parthenolecanium corni TaxID=536013 RepID=A0AAN9TGI1_9HEMI
MVTNTYQASIEGFQTHLGLNETEAINLIKKSVTLCRKAIEIEKSLKMINEDKEILIAGSVGPYGAFLTDGSEYTGNYISTCDIEYIKKWHRPRIQALIEGGVDVLAFETIPALQEAKVLIELLKEYPNMKAWLSFSCKDENYLSYGQSFVEVAEQCWSMNPTQIMAIGVNCLAASTATELIAKLGPKNIPAIIYPNYGKIWDACKKEWVGPSVSQSDEVELYVEKWCELGVKYLGGCCGTSMETYQKMRSIVDAYNQKLEGGTDSFASR